MKIRTKIIKVENRKATQKTINETERLLFEINKIDIF
jgi:hypothetical protein